MISPISADLIVFFTLFFFAVSYITGGGISVLIRLLTGFNYKGSFWQQFVYNIALFVAVIPIVGYLLTCANLFSPIGVYLLILLFGSLYLISILKGMNKKLGNKIPAISLLKGVSKKFENKIPATHLPRPALSITLFFILILIVGLFIRLYALSGEFVYPADDVHQYGLMTHLLIKNKGYTFGLGYLDKYTVPVHTYAYLVGFPALNAFFTLSTGVELPLATALISQIGSTLSILGIYFLGSNIFNEKVGLISGGVMAAIAPWPMSMFIWGGNLEYFDYFLIPIAVVFLFKMLSHSNKKYAVPLGLMLAGTFLIHGIGIWYIVPLMAILTLYYTIKNKSIRPIGLVALSIGISLLLVGPSLFLLMKEQILPAILERSSGDILFSGRTSEFGQGSRILVLGHPLSINYRFIFTDFFYWIPEKIYFLSNYLLLYPIIFIPFYIFKRRNKDFRRGVALLSAWLLGMFLLTENSPHGLYSIPLPFYWVDPGRVTCSMWIPITLLLSVAVYLIISSCISEGVLHRIFTKFNTQKLLNLLAIVFLFFSAIIGSVCVTAIYNGFHSAGRTWISVTEEDVRAFDWIESHTPPESVFLVNNSDAGWWIPEFTDRPALPDWQLINNPQMDDIFELENLLYAEDGLSSSKALYLLQKHDISYIYIGREDMDGRDRPNPIYLLKFHKPVYNKGSIFIIKVDRRDIGNYIISETGIDRRSGKILEMLDREDGVALTGPITIELSLLHESDPHENNIVKIDNEETWYFQLQEYIENRPENWSARICLLPE